MNKLIFSRQEYNKLILDKLKEYIEKYPQLRFNQLLIDLGVLEMEEILVDERRVQVIKDSFYEESETTWNRIKEVH